MSGQLAALRKARKLRLRGVTVETVNPIAVFDRDKWRCQLCGVKTPRKLRGKNQPTSPELDHILPLAVGGEHSYRNTQCACRSCNLAKSSKPLGQTRLFG
ncbi:HNH endonuclease [Mesorhizobium sp. B263B2A]|uniref:HNH endonuclease n=1 Tax=Mesorhizobium sp. B263B2A TaxID=2876669 RepID=UPI001CD07A9A|nr:HNH endonuclease [Mesorhizobium sp. B263B2A]